METRVAPVTGLNGRDGNGSLIQPLYMSHAVRPAGRLADCLLSIISSPSSLGRSTPNARQQRIDAGADLRWKHGTEARAAGATRFAKLLADARGRREAWQAMAAVMDEKAGADGPSDHGGARSAVRASSTSPCASRLPRPWSRDGGDGGRRGAARGAARRRRFRPVFGRCRGQAASREDALRALGEIANFFRRTEPHSPLSYTLDEAVRRGRMTWPDLLAEVVADTDTRNNILNTLGIRPPPPAARGMKRAMNDRLAV